jgi:hypothetical protein
VQFRERKNILSPFLGLKCKQRKKLARSCSNLNLLFDPADGGDMCPRNIRVSDLHGVKMRKSVLFKMESGCIPY